MTQQPWLATIFAVIMIATAAYCLTRLALSWRRGRPTDRTVDAVHVLMGVAMAGMLVSRLRVIPAGGWEALFAAAAALFLYRTARSGHSGTHDVQHLLGCGTMVYMAAAMTTRPAGGAVAASGMSGAPPVSALALVLAVALFGCVVWSADRISTLAPVAALASSAPLGSPASIGSLGALGSEGPLGAQSGPSRAPAGVRGRRSVPLSPRLAVCCEVAMGITMGYMLIVR
jgi:hypothetical protein